MDEEATYKGESRADARRHGWAARLHGEGESDSLTSPVAKGHEYLYKTAFGFGLIP